MPDAINPAYYRRRMKPSPTLHINDDGSVDFQTIDVQEACFSDDPHCWQVFRYTDRAGEKDPSTLVQDLEKALWYLVRRIELAKAAQG